MVDEKPSQTPLFDVSQYKPQFWLSRLLLEMIERQREKNLRQAQLKNVSSTTTRASIGENLSGRIEAAKEAAAARREQRGP